MKYFDRNFIRGLWLGITLTLLFALILEGSLPDLWKENLVGIIATFATLTAAAISLSGPRQQVAEAKRVEDELLRREKLASRSFLPIALTELDGVCDYGIELAFQDDTHMALEEVKERHLTRSRVSERSEKIIRDALKSASPREGETIKLLLWRVEAATQYADRLILKKEYKKFYGIKGLMLHDYVMTKGYISHLKGIARSHDKDLPKHFDTSKFALPSDIDISDLDEREHPFFEDKQKLAKLALNSIPIENLLRVEKFDPDDYPSTKSKQQIGS